MGNKVLKKLTSIALSLTMAFSMYTCQASNSAVSKAQISEATASTPLNVDNTKSKRISTLKRVIAATALSVPIITLAVAAAKNHAPPPAPPLPAPAPAPNFPWDPLAPLIRPKGIKRPGPQADQANAILMQHGYTPERKKENGLFHGGYGAIDEKYKSPMVLSKKDFQTVVNNIPGSVVYRGACSLKKAPMDGKRYLHELFTNGVSSSKSPNARGMRLFGPGLYFSTLSSVATNYALGSPLLSPIDIKEGILVKGFLIGDNPDADNTTGLLDVRCVQSNAKLVICGEPFTFNDDINSMPSYCVPSFCDYIACPQGKEKMPSNLFGASKLIFQKYRDQFQRWDT